MGQKSVLLVNISREWDAVTPKASLEKAMHRAEEIEGCLQHLQVEVSG